jgi:large subunit ribosomal protein L17
MLANMANSLILHKRISTTLAKAKALRVYVEPILTRSKSDTTHNRREVFSLLQSKTVVTELFRDIAIKIGDRPGGYTRILKVGNRLGDNAEMCIIELVDYNENMLSAGKTETTKKRRSRKKSDGSDNEAPKAEVVAPKAEVIAPVVEAVVAAVVAEEIIEEVIEETTVDSVEESEEVAEESAPEAPEEEKAAE